MLDFAVDTMLRYVHPRPQMQVNQIMPNRRPVEPQLRLGRMSLSLPLPMRLQKLNQADAW